MTSANITDAPARRGRPPLNVKETKIRLTEDQRARIEAIVGTYGMSKFIREAVDRELDRREKDQDNDPSR